MKLATLIPGLLLPVVSLAHTPTPLRAADGRDLSFLLKRYDGPIPILSRATKGGRHIVPRTLQVDEVPIRRSLVERQQCTDPTYLPCPDNIQCCPTGATCGPGTCCPAGNLACTGQCCPAGSGDCCPNVGCCPALQACFTALNGEIGCCPLGQSCTTISGCADATAVECPGQNFCCPAGTTCTRDATGNAGCVDKSGSTLALTTATGSINGNTGLSTPNPTTNTGTGPSSQSTNSPNNNNPNSNNNNPNSSNSNNNTSSNGALPQVASASGLMVIVALSGAFLL